MNVQDWHVILLMIFSFSRVCQFYFTALLLEDFTLLDTTVKEALSMKNEPLAHLSIAFPCCKPLKHQLINKSV